MADKKSDEKRPFKERLNIFLTKDIWSYDLKHKGPLRRLIGNTVKVVVIAIRTFLDDKIMTRAAALTYSTLFAVVPILALIFAVARGFGFENIVNSLLANGIIGENESLNTVMQFIDGYMQYVSSGAFVGIGLLFLLWSVYSPACRQPQPPFHGGHPDRDLRIHKASVRPYRTHHITRKRT